MNRQLLKAKVVENGFTMEEFIEKTDMHRTTFYAKLSGKSQFCVDEVVKLCDLLNITEPEEKVKIFLV